MAALPAVANLLFKLAPHPSFFAHLLLQCQSGRFNRDSFGSVVLGAGRDIMLLLVVQQVELAPIAHVRFLVVVCLAQDVGLVRARKICLKLSYLTLLKEARLLSH